MTRGPERFLDDPEWGELFEGFAQEQGAIESLPDEVRRDVAAMVGASVAGAAGAVALGAATSSAASSGATAVSSSALTTAAGSAASSGGASVLVSAASGSVAAVSGAAGGTGVATGSSVAVAASGLSVAGGVGAAGASFAALGVIPKVIAAVSLVGAVTAGGVVVKQSVNSARQPRTVIEAPLDEAPLDEEEPNLTATSDVSKNGTVSESLADKQAMAVLPAEGDDVPVSDDALDADTVQPTVEKVPGTLRGTTPSSSRSPREGSGLAGEVHLLQKARAALSTDREKAWVYLNAYQQKYPEGALRSEYETLVRRAQTKVGASAPR